MKSRSTLAKRKRGGVDKSSTRRRKAKPRPREPRQAPRRLAPLATAVVDVKPGVATPAAPRSPLMNGQQGLSDRFCGRDGKIDYADPRVIRARAQAKHEERRWAVVGQFVVGSFAVRPEDGRLTLRCLKRHPTYMIHAGEMTDVAGEFYRFRTRQAATQWLARNRAGRVRLKVFNLVSLVGRVANSSTSSAA